MVIKDLDNENEAYDYLYKLVLIHYNYTTRNFILQNTKDEMLQLWMMKLRVANRIDLHITGFTYLRRKLYRVGKGQMKSLII